MQISVDEMGQGSLLILYVLSYCYVLMRRNVSILVNMDIISKMVCVKMNDDQKDDETTTVVMVELEMVKNVMMVIIEMVMAVIVTVI